MASNAAKFEISLRLFQLTNLKHFDKESFRGSCVTKKFLIGKDQRHFSIPPSTVIQSYHVSINIMPHEIYVFLQKGHIRLTDLYDRNRMRCTGYSSSTSMSGKIIHVFGVNSRQ